ncbi:MAG: U32 family peptidase [Kiritimatiellae bacterium]|nr:U32 family peptidase [Kiritimatiellia bacterium]
MVKPEILAPAGDFVALRAALAAGADAVYLGLGSFNMRQRASANFCKDDLPEIRSIVGDKKIYLTLNSIIYEGEIEEVEELIKYAKNYVDAFIVADWGVIELCKKHDAVFHISTQMSCSNSVAAKFLKAQGAERVVLARECSLSEVKKIIEEADIEVETFVHGAQCVALSGRCLMSHEAFGCSANRGECHQPCRRRFLVKAVDLYTDKEGKPVHESDTEFVVEPHTVLSAKDLCSLAFVDKLIEAGIRSFKIEGRARNPEYVKTVVSAYRRAVDAVAEGTYTQALVSELTEEVKKVFHREFSVGMYYGRPGVDQMTDSEDSLATTVKRHVGIVIDYFAKAGIAQVKVQDHEPMRGETLQIHGKTTGVEEFVLGEMRRDEEVVTKAERGNWVTFKAPRCRVGDKVFYIEEKKELNS